MRSSAMTAADSETQIIGPQGKGIVMKPHWPVPAGLHTASAELPVESRLTFTDPGVQAYVFTFG